MFWTLDKMNGRDSVRFDSDVNYSGFCAPETLYSKYRLIHLID